MALSALLFTNGPLPENYSIRVFPNAAYLWHIKE